MKILKETGGFLILLGLIIGFLAWVSDNLAPVHGAEKVRMKRLLENVERVEAINVGDSHGMALDYHVIRVPGFHLWRRGSDLFEVSYQLDAVAPLLYRLKIVFLNISPMIFGRDNGSSEHFHSIRQAYYEITPTLRSWRIIHGDFNNLIRGKLSPIARDDHWRGVARSSLTSVFLARKKQRKYQIDEFGYIGKPRETVYTRKSGGNVLPPLFKEFESGNLDVENESYQELSSSIRTLRNRNVRVIVYTTPLIKEVNDSLVRTKPKEIQRTRQYIERLQKEHGIEYYDFMQDEAFTRYHHYFFDPDHLNKYGSAVFSKKLAETAKLPRAQEVPLQ